jgi:hypothetical protein
LHIAQSAAHEQLGQPHACAVQILARIVARSTEIAHRLFGGRRWSDRCEEARSQQLGQLAGVPTIGLDAVAQLPRNQ